MLLITNLTNILTMCWVTKDKAFMVERTAENDIDVFKVVYVNTIGQIISMIAGFQYTLGVVYSEQMKQDQSGSMFSVCEGFHSYTTSCIVRTEFDGSYCVYHGKERVGMFFGRGRHRVKLMKCRIPKGAHYYMNGDGECVSDRILPIELCEIGFQVEL